MAVIDAGKARGLVMGKITYKHAILSATEGAAVAAISTDEDAQTEAEAAWESALLTLDAMREVWFADQPDAWTELALRVYGEAIKYYDARYRTVPHHTRARCHDVCATTICHGSACATRIHPRGRGGRLAAVYAWPRVRAVPGVCARTARLDIDTCVYEQPP